MQCYNIKKVLDFPVQGIVHTVGIEVKKCTK